VRKQFAIPREARVRRSGEILFRPLKLSNGNFEKLRQAVDLAKIDWRDLLVAAGFANDVEAHKKWEIK
jgi:hypothetical protein